MRWRFNMIKTSSLNPKRLKGFCHGRHSELSVKSFFIFVFLLAVLLFKNNSSFSQNIDFNPPSWVSHVNASSSPFENTNSSFEKINVLAQSEGLLNSKTDSTNMKLMLKMLYYDWLIHYYIINNDTFPVIIDSSKYDIKNAYLGDFSNDTTEYKSFLLICYDFYTNIGRMHVYQKDNAYILEFYPSTSFLLANRNNEVQFLSVKNYATPDFFYFNHINVNIDNDLHRLNVGNEHIQFKYGLNYFNSSPEYEGNQLLKLDSDRIRWTLRLRNREINDLLQNNADKVSLICQFSNELYKPLLNIYKRSLVNPNPKPFCLGDALVDSWQYDIGSLNMPWPFFFSIDIASYVAGWNYAFRTAWEQSCGGTSGCAEGIEPYFVGDDVTGTGCAGGLIECGIFEIHWYHHNFNVKYSHPFIATNSTNFVTYYHPFLNIYFDLTAPFIHWRYGDCSVTPAILTGSQFITNICACARPLAINTTVTTPQLGECGSLNRSAYTGRNSPGAEQLYTFIPACDGNYSIVCTDVTHGNANYEITNGCSGSATSLASTDGGTMNVTLFGGTTYYIIVDNPSNNYANYAYGQVRVTCNGLPATPAPTLQSPFSGYICISGTVTLNANVNACGYDWEVSVNGAAYTDLPAPYNTQQNPSFPIGTCGTYIYRLRVTNMCGSFSAGYGTTATVRVIDPTISNITYTPVCYSGSTTLTIVPGCVSGCPGTWEYAWLDMATGKYWNGTSWSSASPVYNASYISVVSSPLLTTQSFRGFRRCSSLVDCSASYDISVTVNPQPDPLSINPIPNLIEVCEGYTNLTIGPPSSTPDPGCTYEYRYSTNNGTTWSAWSTTIPSFPSVAPLTNIIQSRVNCGGTSGCISDTRQVSWAVDPDPSAVISPTSVTVCPNGTATLTATPTGGIPPLSYQWQYSITGCSGPWSDYTSGSGYNTSVLNTAPSNITVYFRVGVSSTGPGCTTTYSNCATVSIYPTPSFTHVDLNPTCGASNGYIHIHRTSSTTGPYSFSIDNGATWSSDSSFNFLGNGTYFVLVRDGHGCYRQPAQVVSLTEGGMVPPIIIPDTVVYCFGEGIGVLLADTTSCPSCTIQWYWNNTSTLVGTGFNFWPTTPSGGTPPGPGQPYITGPGTYTFLATQVNGLCESAPDVVRIIVNPQIVPTITGPTDACLLTPATYTTTAIGGHTYSWSISDTRGGSITGTGPNFNPTHGYPMQDTITLTESIVMVGRTCSGSTIKIVNVNDRPTPWARGDTTICAGNSFNLYGDTMETCVGSSCTMCGSYCTINATSPNANAFISNVTLNAASNTTAYNGLGYNNHSGALFTTLSRGVTYNMSVTLTSTAVTRYLEVYIDWNRDCDFNDAGEQAYVKSIPAGGGLFNFNINVPYYATLGNTRMRVILRTSNNFGPCNSTTLGEIEDYQLKIIKNDPNIVWGNISWSGPAGYNSTQLNNVVTNAQTTNAGVYTLTQTNDKGCTWSESVTVNVNPLPEPVITGPVDVCKGQTGSVYSVPAITGTYVWALSGGTIVSGAGTRQITVNWGNVPGTYTITVTETYDATGCTGTGTLSVDVLRPPDVEAGPDIEVCEGQTISLHGDTITLCTVGCGVPGPYCLHYSDNSNFGYVSNVHLNTGTQVSVASTYTAFPQLTALLTGSSYSLQITDIITNNNGQPLNFSYTTAYFDWNRDGVFEDSVAIGTHQQALGTYNTSNLVTVPDYASLGQSIMRIVYRINTGLAINSKTTRCRILGPIFNGEVEDYIIEVQGHSCVPSTYHWTGPNGFSVFALSTTRGPMTLADAGNYTLTIQCTNGCSNSDVTHVTVDPLPTPVINGPGTSCEFGTGNLYYVSPPTGYVYTWSVTGGSITTNVVNDSVWVDWYGGPTGTITVKDSNTVTHCVGTSSRTITIVPPPSISMGRDTTLCPGTTYRVPPGHTTVTNSSGYLWTHLNGGGSLTSPTTLTPTYTPAATDTGNIYLELTAYGNSTCPSVHAVLTIHYKDTVDPNITCPGNLSVACRNAVPAPDTNLVVVTDNCSGPFRRVWEKDSTVNKTCANRYTIFRRYRAYDKYLNSATCLQTITVNDTVRPTFTVPANVTIYRTAACTYSSTAPGSTGDVINEADNCGGTFNATYTDNTVTDACNITITRNWLLADSCGNSRSYNQTITVTDSIRPVFVFCPGNQVVNANSGNTYIQSGTGWDATATDNCPPAPTLSVSLTGATTGGPYTTLNTVVFNEGVTTVTWTATDACGNTRICRFTVTVNRNTDLSISKTASPDPAVAGQTLIYTITVTNNGPSDAQNVQISDNITAFASPTYSLNLAGPWNPWVSPLAIGTLTAASPNTYTIYIKGTVSLAQCTNISNTASVTTTTPESNTGNNTVTITTTVSDTTHPVITNCPVTRNLSGCRATDITGPSYSTSLANSTYTEFSNGTNQGIASDNCSIFSVTYQDVASGRCPITVTRT